MSNTRELNRVPEYKMSILYTNYWWSMLHSFSSILITMCSPWGQYVLTMCYMQVHLFRNNIPMVKSSPKHTSLPSTAATYLAMHLIAVLQPSRYSIFHSRDTPIQLGLPWWSYSCQCRNTETSAQGNRSFTTETLSISYTFCLYIRLVVTL